MAGTLSSVSIVSTNVAVETLKAVGWSTEEDFCLQRRAVSPSSSVVSFIKTSFLNMQPEGREKSGEDNLILPSSKEGFRDGGMGVQDMGKNWIVEDSLGDALQLSSSGVEVGERGG